MHCICMAYGCELQVGTMFVVLCIPLYYYQPGEFLCSGTDAPMCSLLHLLHVPCSAMYKCFGVWLCLPVQCYGPLFSWSIQLPLGFVCSAHVGGHNPGTLGGVGLVVSWYTRVRKSSSSSSIDSTFIASLKVHSLTERPMDKPFTFVRSSSSSPWDLGGIVTMLSYVGVSIVTML